MVAPALIMVFSTESKIVAVIDDTHRIYPLLSGNDGIEFVSATENLDAARADESPTQSS